MPYCQAWLGRACLYPYRYKLVTVSNSQEAREMEKGLRERLHESSLSFFAICHDGGNYDIMGDAGTTPREEAVVQKARAMAAAIKKGRPPAGQPIESCTIITTTANEPVSEFHDRMPVILDSADYELWLDPTAHDAKRLLPLLKPYPAQKRVACPVSSTSPANGSPGLREAAGWS